MARIENARFPDSPETLAPFVWSLTRGHPWSVHKAFEAIGELGPSSRKVIEQDLRNLLDTRCPGDTGAFGDVAVDYFLDDLSGLRNHLITWSPARDVIIADEAKRAHATDIGPPDLIQDEVANWCWLRPDFVDDQEPVLHDWFRRVLLHRLVTGRHRTPDASDNWQYIHEALRHHGEENDRPLDEHYHAVAQGELDGAASYLGRRFDELGAGAWITEFDIVTSAPQRSDKRSAEDRQADLVKTFLAKKPVPDELPPTDPHGDRWVTILGLVAARWIWSDPLGDPLVTLNPLIGNGLRDLARRSPPGAARLIAEARLYEQGNRP